MAGKDHYQQLLNKLVLSDSGTREESERFEQLGPILNSIYRSRRQEEFIDHITAFIKQKEGEVEQLCNEHYQEFVQSVDQLLKVRRETAILREKLEEFNEDVQSSSSRITSKKKDLIEMFHTYRNIDEVVTSMADCITVLEMANKANQHKQAGNYYPALKILSDLQQNHLHRLLQNDFAQFLHKRIPKIIGSIKRTVTIEFEDWFESLEEKLTKVGKVAFDQTRGRQEKWRKYLKSSISVDFVDDLSASIEAIMEEENEVDMVNNNDVKIEYKLLLQCLHIYDVLGKRMEFKETYCRLRQERVTSILNSFVIDDSDIAKLHRFLQLITGFLLNELVIINIANDFVSKTALESLWEKMQSEIFQELLTCMQSVKESLYIVEMKHAILVFIGALEFFGFSVNSLLELSLPLHQSYCDLLSNEIAMKMKQILLDEELTPLMLKSQEEYDALINLYTFNDPVEAKERVFPMRVPFSSVVPATCELIYEFVDRLNEFQDRLEQQQDEMYVLMKKSLDILLIEQINDSHMEMLMAANLGQISQILVNLNHFKLATYQFEKYLQRKLTVHRISRLSLTATTRFQETVLIAEKRISQLIIQKIDHFFELTDYQWISPHQLMSPSSWVIELRDYLSAIINTTLGDLEDSTRISVMTEGLIHLDEIIMEMLTSPSVKSFNKNFILHLKMDLDVIGSLAAELSEREISNVVIQARQGIMLLNAENPQEMVLQPQLKAKLDHLPPKKQFQLLEKINHAEFQGKGFESQDKARKKLVEQAMKVVKLQFY